MGFIRGGLFVIVSVLFFISLLVMNSIMVVSFSLDYDNIKQELVPVVKETIQGNINLTNIIEDKQYRFMQTFCKNSSQELEYVFSEQNYTFSVSCSAISNGTKAVFDEVIDNFIYEQYHKEYNCGFIDCFKEGSIPFFLVSQHSNDYWQAKFYLFLLISLVLAGLMLLFIEKRTNLPLVAGSLVILSSLLFAKLETLAKWVINTFTNISVLSPLNPDNSFKYFNLIFTQSYKVFLIMIIIGVVLLAFGIILKFFAIGFKINEFFSKFGSKGKAETKEEDKPKDKTPKKKKS